MPGNSTEHRRSWSIKSLLQVCVLGCLISLCSCSTTPQPTAIVPATALPPAVTMNTGAGRGYYLIVTLRLGSGQKLPLIVDTGSPVTVLAKSLEPKLGKRLGSGTAWDFSVKHEVDYYGAPKLYLGGTRLMTGSYVYTMNTKHLFSGAHRPIMGILGMDCLKHYCIQLDFQAEKVRFLNPDQVNAGKLGKAFRFTFSNAGQSKKGLFRPLIHQPSLIGEEGHKLLVDTGYQYDGALASALFGREVGIQSFRTNGFTFTYHPPRKTKWFAKCVWNSKTYTNLIIGNGGPSLNRNGGNEIGLRFLARNLVTLNFPKRTMYLKQTSVGPLPGDHFVKQQIKLQTWLTSAMASLKEALKSGKSPRVKSAQSAIEFLMKLKKEGQLPGWSKNDHGTVKVDFFHENNLSPAKDQLHSYFYGPVTYPESAEISGRKKGDSSTYHYKVIRASKTSPWKLEKAWRTDQNDHTIKSYPVP